jgi:hypothetical protein
MMHEEGCTVRSGMELLMVTALICVIATNVIAGQIEERHHPHIADVVGDKHSISGTQILTAEVEPSLLSAQTTKGSKVLLGPHNLHKLLGLLHRDGVPQEIH